MHLRVALLGFGNVNGELAQLITRKTEALQQEYGLTVSVVGVGTGSKGFAINRDGLDTDRALGLARAGQAVTPLNVGPTVTNAADFVAQVPADLLFEAIPTNPVDGQPALDLLRAALSRGLHVVTANKGPVVWGLRDLTALAEENGVGFLYEASVMGGAPVLATVREGLVGARVYRIRAIFNSTTNYILTAMSEDGQSFEEALKGAQQIGVAETDPTLDVDGWDSAIKTAITANLAMGADLRPADVDRTGIGDVTLDEVQAARGRGERYRLVCEATRSEDGSVRARVAPLAVPLHDPLAMVGGTNTSVTFEADALHALTVTEGGGGPDTTAYGMFADMLNILRGRHHTGLV